MKLTGLLSLLPVLALAAPALAAPTHGHGARVARHAAPIAQTQNMHLVRRGLPPKKCGVPDPVDDDEEVAPAEGHGEPAKEEHAEAPAEAPAAAEEHKPEQHDNGFHDEGKHPENYVPEHEQEHKQEEHKQEEQHNIGHNLNAAPAPQHEEHKPEEHKPEEHKPEEHKPEEHKPEEHKPAPAPSGDRPNHKVDWNGDAGVAAHHHNGEVFTGKGTHYNLDHPWENEGYAPGTVACINPGTGPDQKLYKNEEFVVALNHGQYDAYGGRNGGCFRWVRIEDTTTGNWKEAQVVDRCGGDGKGSCAWGDLDLSQPLWNALHGHNNNGVFNLKWSFI
ncbi:hypothetical protein Q8F55_002721 [Vanrija albida]|uniref:Uncharacterized protein n=1 Tax=Vanrija albida TaxID=181172 RepID=A0ABR3QAL7_9TREE